MVTAHPEFNLLVSNYLITLINPLRKNDLGGKVSDASLPLYGAPLSNSCALRREGRQEISNISQGCHICVIMSSLPVLNQTEFSLETHISALFSYLPQCSVISNTKQRTGNLNGRVWQPLSKPFLQEAAKILKL